MKTSIADKGVTSIDPIRIAVALQSKLCAWRLFSQQLARRGTQHRTAQASGMITTAARRTLVIIGKSRRVCYPARSTVI
jgi:hypothetical protein